MTITTLYHLRNSLATGTFVFPRLLFLYPKTRCDIATSQKGMIYMAKAKKLASGSWRCLAYSHTERVWDPKKKEWKEKRIYESFTARTKKEAELMAAEFAVSKDVKKRPDNLTIYEAIDRYIQIKEGVLSPTTVRTYKSARRTHFEDIGDLSIRDINGSTVQAWISELSIRLQPKTIKNTYGLLVSTLDMFNPDLHIKVQLPQKKSPEFYTPSDSDIKKLLSQIEGTELEIAVLLAAFGTLRRGEICALTDKDIHGNYITVNHAFVRNENNEWILKEPKTAGSKRTIELPEFVINKMKGIDGYIVKLHPDALSERFRRAVKKSGLPQFRFHDLRHYSASILHAIGVPDQYIMQRGGWVSDHVMKSVYRNIIDEESAKQNQKIIAHFNQMQHEIQHEE